MKTVVQRIAGVALTCLLTWLMVSKLCFLVRPVSTDEVYSQVETLHSLPRDSVEVMIYGSSHAFRGISAMELYDRYGIGAYNYGWHWLKINTVHLFLKDSLEVQTPRLVLIEAGLANNVVQDTDITAEIYFSRYLHNGAARAAFLKQCFGNDPERYLSFYMPLCAFHDNWSTLEEQSFRKLEKGTFLRKNMGFFASDDVTEIRIPDYHTFRQRDFSEAAREELLGIIETCHEKGIQVIFFTVPWQEDYEYGDAMKTIAKGNGCDYFDFFELAEETGLDGKTDFSDTGHLNTSGAVKVADYLGRYISCHYELTDMRTIEDNLWEQAKEME